MNGRKKMIDVYRVVYRWSFIIEKVKADRVTKSSVFIEGRRAAKQSDGVKYFEDFGSAKKFSINILNEKLRKLKRQTEVAETDLEYVKKVTDTTIKVSTSRW